MFNLSTWFQWIQLIQLLPPQKTQEDSGQQRVKDHAVSPREPLESHGNPTKASSKLNMLRISFDLAALNFRRFVSPSRNCYIADAGV